MSAALERALDRVGDRWTLLVVEALLVGPRRFNDLVAALAGIAPNILAKRLRRLEAEGLIVSRPYSARPVRLEYELTAAGRDLAGALALLAEWGARSEGLSGARHHDSCGGELETRAWCPTCERAVDDDETGELHHV